jgi:signal transduction histidine kinase
MFGPRACSPLKRLWPKTLFGQLLVIMVSGTLAIQFLSSSIWFDVRFAQILEAPVRLIASRTAPLLARDACRAIESMRMPVGYQMACVSDPPLPAGSDHQARRRTELLLQQSLERELGHPQPVRVMDVHLTDEQGHRVVWRSFFGLRTATAHVLFAVPLDDGAWLQIQGEELQGWSGESAWAVIADYAFRVYLLRILAVLGMCWLAVRLCLRPLERLSEAARGLSENLEQPALEIEGPREVRRAARVFNAMQQRLVTMMHDQSYFLAAVSHDLRTPLTRMRLRVETIADERQRERLTRNVAQMDRMIGQVLDYLGTAEQQPCQLMDLDHLLSRLSADLATSDEPLPVHGRAGVIFANEVLVQRCVQNLVVNALHYARRIAISANRDERGVTVSIEDRGPGLPASVMNAFEDTCPGRKSTRHPSSASHGLGLSIARRIATIHDGALSLTNLDHGLLAELYFPHKSGVDPESAHQRMC